MMPSTELTQRPRRAVKRRSSTAVAPVRPPASASPTTNVNDLERAASVVLGAALLALGTRRPSLARAPLALGGGMLLYRGLSGRCPGYRALGLTSVAYEGGQPQSARLLAPHRVEPARTPRLEQSITVRASADELVRQWKRPEVLAQVAGDFAQVRAIGDELEWTVELPLGQSARFVTRWLDTAPPDSLSWTSTGEGAGMSGTLRCEPAPGDWGTVVRLTLDVQPPGGSVGVLLAKALGSVPEKLMQKALRSFKSLVETGEIPNIQQNPAARRGGKEHTKH